MKRKIETGEDASLEPLKALFGEVTDPDIVAKKKRIHKKCPHEKLKYNCRICTPKLVCPHKILEKCCRICTPKLMCPHKILETNCRICTPKIFCECGIRKTGCHKHGGSAQCIVCKFVQANPKYDKHCVDCFVNFYPDDARSNKSSKLKRCETVVREAIDGVFKGFIHDKAFFTGGCCEHRRRIDHRIPIRNRVGDRNR